MPMSLIFNNLFISWVLWLLHVDINLVEFCPNGVSLGYSFLIADYTHGTLWPSVANFIGRTGVHSNIKVLDVFNIAIKLSNTTWFGRCAAVVETLLTTAAPHIINHIGLGVLSIPDTLESAALALKATVCRRILYCFDALQS